MSKTQSEFPPPKRPLTGFFSFQAEQRAKNHQVTVPEVKVLWEKLGEQGKKKYNDVFSTELEKYKEKLAAHEAKYGKYKKPKKEDEKKEISKPEKEKGGITRRSKEKKVEEKVSKKASLSKEKSKSKKEVSKGKPGKSKK